MWRSIKVSLFSLIGLALTVATQAQVNTNNLLTNPGAETGDLSDWTVGGVSNPNVDNGRFDAGINPHTGAFDFYGGTGANGSLTQSVSLLGTQGITGSLIDSGTLTANIEFFAQGLNQGSPSDSGQVGLTFHDSANAVINTVLTPEVDSHNGIWQQYDTSYTIPAGTRSIDYTMFFIRHVGSDNDSFIDDNVLTIRTSGASATPAPSALVTTLIGIVPGVMLLRRRRK